MITLHQLRCFAAVFDEGSVTAAAAVMRLAQPSVSEQVRLLEGSLGTLLFQRVGRGLLPSEAAKVLRVHAQETLDAAQRAVAAVTSVKEVVSGTIRFGVFGTSRLYLDADLIGDVLDRHPGVRIELMGLNSTDVQEQLRRGRLEAGIIALPIADAGLTVTPIMRDEVVYISAVPERVQRPVSAAMLAAAPLVLAEASWGNEDSTRRQLSRAVQSVGGTLTPLVDVEDIETALEVAATGRADAITARGLLRRMGDRLSPDLKWVPLRPRLYDEFAVVTRRDVPLSRASQVVIELAVARMRAVASQP
ncbi:DNA-binding transcriptional regulator, LysR family [Nakamurella panacisegetis]|uniref:DNA-binding transcriptional regulator, LysR family n=1 Tax=Nakamurella panacisegetis TaxID=1090615 RepID=A0A1H0PMS0_9ACTN|nr:LysR family transcriptional regulator [Nakamurella panacisegetis]SDP05876.1 DNA-binding transcriptional regulator, LysR family [Nakamurella panacisegetis]